MKRFKVEYYDWIDAGNEKEAVKIFEQALHEILKEGNIGAHVCVKEKKDNG